MRSLSSRFGGTVVGAFGLGELASDGPTAKETGVYRLGWIRRRPIEATKRPALPLASIIRLKCFLSAKSAQSAVGLSWTPSRSSRT